MRICSPLPWHMQVGPNAPRTAGSSLAKRQFAKESIVRKSIHFLNCWTTCSTTWHVATTRHATFWHTTTPASSLVDFHHDRIHNALELLLLCLKLILLSKLVLVQPVQSLLHRLLDLVLVIAFKLFLQPLLL